MKGRKMKTKYCNFLFGYLKKKRKKHCENERKRGKINIKQAAK